MDSTAPPEALRKAIAEAVAEFAQTDRQLVSLRERLGLESADGAYPEEGWRDYMRSYQDTVKSDQDLINVAQRVVQQIGSERVEEMLRTFGLRTRFGELQNLIFAGNGAKPGRDPRYCKPEIVLVDATSNRIKITKNAEFWLVYDRPLLFFGGAEPPQPHRLVARRRVGQDRRRGQPRGGSHAGRADGRATPRSPLPPSCWPPCGGWASSRS
ncbi:hypothetical protein ACFV9E_38460 [Streptomyces sp. NPDC059835]|uniref:hypothetical protein n=1 Tax=Streptomyces sp. NPDC059835 TaxID=3346967 RepID=UPI00365F4F8E